MPAVVVVGADPCGAFKAIKSYCHHYASTMPTYVFCSFASRAGRPLSHRSHGPSGIVSCTSFAGGGGGRRVLGEFEIFWLGFQGLGVEIWGMGREVLEFRD